MRRHDKLPAIQNSAVVFMFSIMLVITCCCCSPVTGVMTTPNRTVASLNKPGIPKAGNDFTSYKTGIALLNSGKYNQSLAYFDKALAINPKDFFALYNKGSALLNLGKYNQSLAYFDKALAINPKDFFALYNKGSALLNLGKYN